ncbi:MAG: hypothetical protein P0S94_02955 [Simkaniaceae bacterium]|nr:hypothetical protein [Simkaniaceae bacterium]
MEILVVASKVKKHIKEKHGMNTSSSAMEALTHEVVKALNHAAENAKSDKRKTIMDRDFR